MKQWHSYLYACYTCAYLKKSRVKKMKQNKIKKRVIKKESVKIKTTTTINCLNSV